MLRPLFFSCGTFLLLACVDRQAFFVRDCNSTPGLKVLNGSWPTKKSWTVQFDQTVLLERGESARNDLAHRADSRGDLLDLRL